MSKEDLRELVTSRSAFQSMQRRCGLFEVDKVIQKAIQNIKPRTNKY